MTVGGGGGPGQFRWTVPIGSLTTDRSSRKLPAQRERPVPVLPAVGDLQPPRQPLRPEADTDAAGEADVQLRLADEADAEAGDVGDRDLAGRGVVVVAEEDPAGGLAQQPRPAA